LEVALLDVEILVVVEEQVGDLMRTQSNAVELVNVVEDGQILVDSANFISSGLHLQCQLLLCLACVLG
jgi:hypothetical protein